MGGDHKCPVCEATFTRPQHVARHMRSHTGDRPYKCQYCGDQFARSDLLSRHVNKCHANEKPLPTTGVRRKGSASASRATTSKQVCDQCVQANTSCDGSNPCAKCVQRKYRCTFVKFHRQTAPVGPGHAVRPVPETSSGSPSPTITGPLPSSRVPMYQQNPEEDFILSPPPLTVVPNTMADALYGTTSFTFPPLYPTDDITADNTDYVGKYRAHTELFESARSGMSTGAASHLGPTLYDSRSSSSWLGWGQQDPTNPYQHHHHHHHHHHHQQEPAPSSSLSPIMNDRDMQAELAHHHHQQQQQQRSNMNQNHYVTVSIPYHVPQQSTTSNYHLSDPNAIGTESNDIIDIYGSDSAPSSSVPSSAASSLVHLPLAGGVSTNTTMDGISTRRESLIGYDNNGALLVPDQSPTSSTSSPSHPDSAFQSQQLPFSTHDQNGFSSHRHLHQHHHQHQPTHSHPHHLQQQIVSDLGRPEFSSAFGLLSLDPMAGIETDGTPFFDDPNQAHNQARSATSGSTTSRIVQLDGSANMDTPMPRRDSGQLQLPPEASQRFPISSSSSSVGGAMENRDAPSREKDSKELKEFWKQYMRLPLSGSGMFSSAAGSEGVTPSGNTSKATNTSGSGPGYRRARVASLPAVKTPILDGGHSNHSNFSYLNSNLSTFNFADGNEQGPTGGGGGARRPPSREVPGGTGMGDKEDLRSYEAAVMARKAPTNLKLRRPMRGERRGGGGNGGGGQLNDEESASASSGDSSPCAMGGDTTDCSSSLANVFGAVSHSRDQTILSRGGVPSATFQFTGSSSMDAVKKEDGSSPSLSSRASSLSADLEGDDDGRTDVVGGLEVVSSSLMGRPSFKRLPSQTLGPDNSKRAFYGFGEGVEDPVVSGWGVVDDNDHDHDHGGSSLAERMRKRRMSEPAPSLTAGFYRGREEE